MSEERVETVAVNGGGGEREGGGGGLFVTLYITAFMYKSNDILRKQTALKGERKLSVLAGYSIVFMLHVIGVYWWYQNDDLCYPLFMVPPKAIPPFWNAIFIIIVNDTLARQAAMAFKLVLLMYYKNGRGHSFRRQILAFQGQMLTLVEYTLLLYRTFLPAPVWYRFFLNKEYGSLFSSLTTGLYLTLKLTSCIEKVSSFYAALKALSRKEVNYGSHATPEQVSEAGDLCAICQEKMQAPILLRCKHIFCEDCVSEWLATEQSSHLILILYFKCLKEKELAHYAEHWLDQLIYDHLGMAQRVCSSSCSRFPIHLGMQTCAFFNTLFRAASLDLGSSSIAQILQMGQEINSEISMNMYTVWQRLVAIGIDLTWIMLYCSKPKVMTGG
ncbi:zinc finger, RING/FYVE/PHD-type [Artemisia annua]|uniref:Zinc finger, RING/FYVE/PHD-type n=1 Tax=Artemisia annua TaxID=35608 RepID=A0A2U1QJX4_ARTAN|nr:zinc finger, RING/FYVE/PHD-type [Artemisia annua]